ncbi:MAG: bifunctional diaminohydroxyphosphoribosylaminopyrimidine deaminase/5-amino-6-(5-phosphoribosylamino)uracil reductase RibD [Deltaproteobacteria bacterium]|nr:bifunctional diaminohydroxyphosphoribosylaminopyrimidine deaminase/5-amino-6-(5-phosphoribosylamino)uracil reductase RibD [Deltaproteobacteria bacterium]
MVHFTEKETFFMKEALRLARQGWGLVSPNPMVGAVLVKRGKIIAQGWHLGPGLPHAEAAALSAAGSRAKGADLYVNLEPCNHHGRTGPCAEAIIKSGVKKVFYSIPDPNPLAKGGSEALENAGIATSMGLLADEAFELNQFFIKWQLTKKPFVILKTAASLDGKIATSTGDSRWISSKVARNFSHHLRTGVDAIMIGRATAFKDDPELSARPWGRRKMHKQPMRVVLDPLLKLPLNLKLFEERYGGPTTIFCSHEAPEERISAHVYKGTRVIKIGRTSEGLLSLSEALSALGELEVQSVLMEAGATLAASALISENVVDLIHIFIAPKFIGGVEAPSMLGGAGVPTIDGAKIVDILKVGRKGPDIHLTIRPKGAFKATLGEDGSLVQVKEKEDIGLEEPTAPPSSDEDSEQEF